MAKDKNLKDLIEKKWGEEAKTNLVLIRAETLNEDDDKMEAFAYELCSRLGIKAPDEATKGAFHTQCWRLFSEYKIPIKPNKFREFLKTQKQEARESIPDDWKKTYGTYVMPACTGYAVDLVRAGKNLLLVGPKGCGKTELGRIIFEQIIQCEFETIDLSQNITRVDLEGQMALKDGETVWQDGLLARAARNQRGILFNELDAAPEDLATGMMELFESHRYTLMQTGERLNAEGSPIIGTSNTVGEGSNEMYTRQFIDKAFLSRVVPINMNYPTPEVEEKILLTKAPTIRPTFARKLIEFANWTRKAHHEGELTDVISTRELVQCVDMFGMNARWDETAAIKITLCNRFAGQELVHVCGAASSTFTIKDLEMNPF